MEGSIIYLVINALNIWMMSRYMNLFLDKKKKNNVVLVLSAIIYWLVNSTVYRFVNAYQLNLLTDILGLALISFSFKGSIWKKILAIFSTLTIGILVESIVGFSWVALGNSTADIRTNIMAILFFSLTEIVIERIWGLKEKEPLPGSYYFCMMLLPVFSIVTFLLFMEVIGMFLNPVWLVVVAIVILILSILVYTFSSRMFDLCCLQ